jgi:hypothetical protein
MHIPYYEIIVKPIILVLIIYIYDSVRLDIKNVNFIS